MPDEVYRSEDSGYLKFGVIGRNGLLNMRVEFSTVW